jgi:ribonuclease HII
VNDSKKLTETQREELYAQIIATPGVLYAVCVLYVVLYFLMICGCIDDLDL